MSSELWSWAIIVFFRLVVLWAKTRMNAEISWTAAFPDSASKSVWEVWRQQRQRQQQRKPLPLKSQRERAARRSEARKAREWARGKRWWMAFVPFWPRLGTRSSSLVLQNTPSCFVCTTEDLCAWLIVVRVALSDWEFSWPKTSRKLAQEEENSWDWFDAPSRLHQSNWAWKRRRRRTRPKRGRERKLPERLPCWEREWINARGNKSVWTWRSPTFTWLKTSVTVLSAKTRPTPRSEPSREDWIVLENAERMISREWAFLAKEEEAEEGEEAKRNNEAEKEGSVLVRRRRFVWTWKLRMITWKSLHARRMKTVSRECKRESTTPEDALRNWKIALTTQVGRTEEEEQEEKGEVAEEQRRGALPMLKNSWSMYLRWLLWTLLFWRLFVLLNLPLVLLMPQETQL